ncbi:hypothetical protein RN001_015203 [Aquatica leii]|uniref:Uncharacterized protein n=1 Tax=Aquatica leii TaxID=1421715 RepID=A0AAN7NYX2_9COLE|nr:hypothetical protein RN001_015203 [Aquatica leii]
MVIITVFLNYATYQFYLTHVLRKSVKMLTVIVAFALLFFVVTNANGPYHHIIIQIYDNEDTLVPSILTVKEGANLTLNCRTLHLIHHPGST